MSRLLLCIPLLAVALVCACGEEAPVEPTRLQVGSHSIVVTLPDGWEHLDYGSRHQLRRGLSRISIEDLETLGTGLNSASRLALSQMKEMERRDEASRERFQITGREALAINTWDRMSHQWRKRFIFVDNGGSYLVVYTMSGAFEKMETAFDSLVTSLAFTDSLPRIRQHR